MENSLLTFTQNPNQKNKVNTIHTATHLPRKAENAFLIMANQR